MIEQRIKSVQKIMREGGADSLIINGNSNNFYLSGVADKSIKNIFYSVITNNNFYFIATRFHLKQVTENVPQKNIVLVEEGHTFGEAIAGILRRSKKTGFESRHFSYAKYAAFKKLLKGKKLVPFENTAELPRRIKDEIEILKIKKAAAITDKTFSRLLEIIKPGVSENFLKQKAAEIMNRLGADGPAFDPLVSSGKNTADAHYQGADKKIKKGEMLVIDIGARYKNYNSDMTRTVFLGKAAPKQKEMYKITLEIQQKAVAECVAGAAPKKIHANAVENFKSYGQDKYFIHALGHGVGIDIHELPNFSPAGQGELENGMVFTIEPGIYRPGMGGVRIEDLCLMENNQCQILSKTAKDIIEI